MELGRGFDEDVDDKGDWVRVFRNLGGGAIEDESEGQVQSWVRVRYGEQSIRACGRTLLRRGCRQEAICVLRKRRLSRMLAGTSTLRSRSSKPILLRSFSRSWLMVDMTLLPAACCGELSPPPGRSSTGLQQVGVCGAGRGGGEG